MTLSDMDLFLLSQCAISAAYQAGAIISSHANKDVAVISKSGGDSLAAQVVTEVDHLSQDCILNILKPTCAPFDLAILSEESPDDQARLEKDFFWCVDPMDGTLCFTRSVPGYSVAIALVSKTGEPYIGVIYDPVAKTLYHAQKGLGAFRNGKKLTLAPAVKSQPLTFVYDPSFIQHPFRENIKAGLEKITQTLGYTELNINLYGGSAMNACIALDSAPACYFKYPKANEGGGSLWDFAATACIFQQAGGVATDISGKPLDLNRPDSTFMNHTGVLFATDKDIAEQVVALHKAHLTII
jgi:myo-inositol-1(or 4)-monophosphatase